MTDPTPVRRENGWVYDPAIDPNRWIPETEYDAHQANVGQPAVDAHLADGLPPGAPLYMPMGTPGYSYFSDEPPKKSRKRLIIGASIAGFCLLAIIVAAASGGGTTTTPSAAPVVVATADPPAPAAPAAPSVDQSAAAEYADYAGKFETAFGNLSTDAGNVDIAAVGVDCGKIRDLAVEGLGVPNVGIPDADTAWDSAMHSFITAGSQCESATSTGNADLLSTSLTAFRQGEGYIVQATAAIKAAS